MTDRMKKPGLTYKTFIIALAFAFSGISAIAANRYSVASGSWHSTSTWSVTPGGIPGATVPGKNDDVYLENGHTVTVTSDEACSSITFTGSGGTLVINSPAVLALKTSITLNKLTNSDSYCNLTGTGTLNCIEVVVGSGDNPPPADGGSSVYTHTFTSNIAYLNIAEKGNPKNNLIINSYLGSASHIRNGVFNLESGTLVVEGMIMVNNASSANNSVFSMATGTQSGTLIFGGRSTPVSLSATGINTINFNGTSSLVNYSRAGVQTVFGTPYNNLTLSGSGAKTLNEVTVNGILSVEGTATTTGTTPVYGPFSALQYKGTLAQTAGIEFPLSFNGSDGVIINNVFGINLNSSRTISSKLTFIAGRLNTGVYTLSMTSSATVSGAGAGKYVNGNFQKEIPPGTLSKTFETGDASVYAPVVLTFTGTISAGGSITVKTTAGDHPNLASSTFNSGVTVNRYWTLTNSGVSGFISYSATFNFVAADIDPGADYHHFYVGNYNAATWTYPALGTLAATSTQATGLTSFGDFQIGELPVASYRTRQSGAWNLTSTWESFNGAIWIAAISTPTLAAGYITIRSSQIGRASCRVRF